MCVCGAWDKMIFTHCFCLASICIWRGPRDKDDIYTSLYTVSSKHLASRGGRNTKEWKFSISLELNKNSFDSWAFTPFLKKSHEFEWTLWFVSWPNLSWNNNNPILKAEKKLFLLIFFSVDSLSMHWSRGESVYSEKLDWCSSDIGRAALAMVIMIVMIVMVIMIITITVIVLVNGHLDHHGHHECHGYHGNHDLYLHNPWLYSVQCCCLGC